MKKRIPISAFRHRLQLCSQTDVVQNGSLFLAREGVRAVRATVVPKKASTFSRQGAATKDSRNARTHVITVRHFDDLSISAYAWLFEERRKSPPRWFKILSVVETEASGTRYYIFDCRLTEITDNAPKPDDTPPKGGLDPVIGLPDGVSL